MCHVLFSAGMYIILGLLGTAFTSLFAAESQTLPSVTVDGNFQLQHNSLCLQGTAEASLPKRSTALPVLQNQLFFFSTGCPGPESPGTVGELVDVLVDFVFPSESGGHVSV